jgi:hypothetical protein
MIHPGASAIQIIASPTPAAPSSTANGIGAYFSPGGMDVRIICPNGMQHVEGHPLPTKDGLIILITCKQDKSIHKLIIR